jgi:hypothetical protein
MQLHPMKHITIIGEEILRDQMVRRLRSLGISGCSYHSVYGVGSHESRRDDVFSANFQLEAVCPKPLAEQMMAFLNEHYFGKYAIVAWLSDVEVVREKHFSKEIH